MTSQVTITARGFTLDEVKADAAEQAILALGTEYVTIPADIELSPDFQGPGFHAHIVVHAYDPGPSLTDEDRNEVISFLREQYAEGSHSLLEFEQLVERTLKSRYRIDLPNSAGRYITTPTGAKYQFHKEEDVWRPSGPRTDLQKVALSPINMLYKAAPVLILLALMIFMKACG
jgi:hypothetical protein